MKNYFLIVIGLIVSEMNYAFPITVFDAEFACKAIQTQNGVRFIPECEFQKDLYVPDFNHQLDNASVLKQALYKSKLTYQFFCESLMPLSISYSINEGEEIKISGDLPGSKSGMIHSSELTHSFDRASMELIQLNGAVGFQAIKPGCHLTLENFVSYPEPNYFSLLVDSKIQLDRVLARSLAAVAPDANYLQALSAIENAIFVLDFMLVTVDELTAYQIQETIRDLNETKDKLTVSCDVGSSNQVCTQGIAEARRVLSHEIEQNGYSIFELKRSIDFQLSRFSAEPSDLGEDYGKLVEVQTTLDGYVNL